MNTCTIMLEASANAVRDANLRVKKIGKGMGE